MILYCTEEEANELVQKCLLIPLGDGGFELELNPPKTPDERFTVRVDVKYSEEQSKESNEYTNKQIRDLYKEFLDTHPPSDYHGQFKKTRPLKKDPGSKGLERYRALIRKHGITPDEIRLARDYEVYWRRKASKGNDNKMTYMSGLQPWLNDPQNIKVQLEMLEQDPEYARDGVTEDDDPNAQLNLY